LGLTLTVGGLAGVVPTSVMLALGSLDLPLIHAIALLGTLLGCAAGGMVAAIVGFGGGDKALFEREQKVLQLAAANGGRLSVAQVAAGCQLGVAESKAALEQMCVHGVAEVQITDGGDIVHEFAGLEGAAALPKASEPTAKPRSVFPHREPEVVEAELVEPAVKKSGGKAIARPTLHADVTYDAPYGISPRNGRPFSSRRKTVAGLLQIVPAMIGLGGFGHIYTGHFFRGLAQLILGPLAGLGIVWPVLDGVFILTTERGTDSEGRPLRPDRARLPPHRPV
jgi:hypothetical protein